MTLWNNFKNNTEYKNTEDSTLVDRQKAFINDKKVPSHQSPTSKVQGN